MAFRLARLFGRGVRAATYFAVGVVGAIAVTPAAAIQSAPATIREKHFNDVSFQLAPIK